MTFKPSFAVAAFALALSAAAPALAQTDPAGVQPGAYKVETSHTRVLFAVNHMGFTTWYGDFTGVTGTLTLDPKTPENSVVNVSVPTASISTTNAKLDQELKAADWLDAAKYPAITFKSTKVTVTGPGTADVDGNFTLHGVTKPITLKAKFNSGGPHPMNKVYNTGFEVSGQIKRSEFGVGKYVPLVGDTVDLIISAGFEKTAP